MEDLGELERAGMYGFEAAQAGLVSNQSVKYSLFISEPSDFDTEVFKSDCAFLTIPEIGLEIPDGNSRFTTAGVLLREVYENLKNTPALSGLDKFLAELNDCLGGHKPFHLVIEDALGLSTVNPPTHRASQLITERRSRKASDYIYFGLDRSSAWAENDGDALNTLIRLVRGASRVVILSGAGISTESGIPAFRSPDGMDNLWDKYDPTKATLAAISSDDSARIEYWSMHSELYDIVHGNRRDHEPTGEHNAKSNFPIQRAQPNASHYLAVKLHELGKLHKVVTQNIDGLYQAAGLDPSMIIELHGTITTCRCSHCHHPHDRAQAHEKWKSGVLVPKCDICGAPLRFGTIAFGEPLPASSWELSRDAVQGADLLIIMGSSLVVQPANKLPEISLDQKVPVALLNLGPTPLDRVVDLHILEKCGNVAQNILDNLLNEEFEPIVFAPSHTSSTTSIEPWSEMKLASYFHFLLRRKP